MVVAQVWDRLRGVGQLAFVSRSGMPQATGWVGRGTGAVAVEAVGDDAIVFREEGEWAPESGRPLRFRNAFRWSMGPGRGRLRLEHLRFGDSNPVYLFDLIPAGEDILESAEPHACRLDAYTAKLSCDGGLVRVGWSVVGPGKDESIHYEYQ